MNPSQHTRKTLHLIKAPKMSAKWFISPRSFLFIVFVNFVWFSALTHMTAVAQNNTALIGDRLALLTIKSMIKDDPQGVMRSWKESDTDFCRWEGVTCNLRNQRVTLLNLSASGLVGSLSPSIGNLTFLERIQLQNNSLSGAIPPEIGRLFRLQELRLDNNSFTGNIPTAITNCSNLQVLHLGKNFLVGKIPDGVGSLSMLKLLIMHSNILQGGIPSYIANLTSMETLSFGDCQLGGRIPDIFHRLTNLTRLAMHGNNLVGTIPPSLYNSSSLEQLFLDNNVLTGNLPANIGTTMRRITTFSMSVNRLTGPLPPSILSSPQLRVIDIAENNLSGKLAITPRNSCDLVIVSLSYNNFGTREANDMMFIDEMSICSKLGAVYLDNNQLTGPLPESLGNLSSTLYLLRLPSNHLSGSLPASIGNLSGLTLLDLSSNRFTGALPATIGNLENLQRLNLTNNSFSGNIPDSVGNLSLMIEIYLTSNEFNGSIPSSLGKCKRLLRLNLDRNSLTGDIPSELFELSSLSISLNLGNNRLTGKLPAEVGKLRNLNEMILANNRLSGDIPSSLGSCSSLQVLNISNNWFSGSIPASLDSLRGLENLDVSSNNLTGRIPGYLELLPLRKLDMSSNDFDGEVPKNGVFRDASSVSILGNSRVCGGIVQLRLPKCEFKKKKKLSLVVILVICFSSVLVLAAIMWLWFFACCSRKTKGEDDHERPVLTSTGVSLLQVSYEKLYEATDGFSAKNLIGKGSFSSVYKGRIEEVGADIVAIKVLNLHRRGGSKSFVSECEAMRNSRHRNLTKVITCCSGVDLSGNEFKAIVYEFMPNGSLDQWLHSAKNEPDHQLGLVQRVCIALDVAYGLDYLHNHAGKTIIHCDLKPSNVLLDEEMVAHVADFGLSKILQSEYQNRYNSSSVGVRGTIGYAAPEYGIGSKVSRSGDMYSFGILLLEMLTGKKPTDAMFGEGLSLHNYVKEALDDSAVKIFDPALLTNDRKIEVSTDKEETMHDMDHETSLRSLLEIGVRCSMESPQYRMNTAGVIQELQLISNSAI